MDGEGQVEHRRRSSRTTTVRPDATGTGAVLTDHRQWARDVSRTSWTAAWSPSSPPRTGARAADWGCRRSTGWSTSGAATSTSSRCLDVGRPGSGDDGADLAAAVRRHPRARPRSRCRAVGRWPLGAAARSPAAHPVRRGRPRTARRMGEECPGHHRPGRGGRRLGRDGAVHPGYRRHLRRPGHRHRAARPDRGPAGPTRSARDHPGLRVLYMTGYSGPPDATRTPAPGEPVLRKPYRPDALRWRVAELLSAEPVGSGRRRDGRRARARSDSRRRAPW